KISQNLHSAIFVTAEVSLPQPSYHSWKKPPLRPRGSLSRCVPAFQSLCPYQKEQLLTLPERNLRWLFPLPLLLQGYLPVILQLLQLTLSLQYLTFSEPFRK